MPGLISWSRWKTGTAILRRISSQPYLYIQQECIRTVAWVRACNSVKFESGWNLPSILRFLCTLSRSNFDIFTQPTQKQEFNAIQDLHVLHYQIIHFWNQACIMHVSRLPDTLREPYPLYSPATCEFAYAYPSPHCVDCYILFGVLFQESVCSKHFLVFVAIFKFMKPSLFFGYLVSSNLDIPTQPTQKQEIHKIFVSLSN